MTPDDEVARLRVPPHSVEAEQSLLGGLLCDPAGWDRIVDLVAEADLYRHEHRLIFGAIAAQAKESKPFDVVVVFEQLQRSGRDEQVGGLVYLNQLAQSVPSAANIRRYAEIIREKAVLRAAIATADEVATKAFSGVPAREVLDLAGAGFMKLDRRSASRQPVLLGDVTRSRIERYELLERGEVAAGVTVGMPKLEERLNGGLRSGLIVIAARPSVGKSAFSQQLAEYMALTHNMPGLFFSQEMPKARLVDRAISRIGRVPLNRLISGKLRDGDWGGIATASDKIKSMPFYVEDEPAQKIAQIRAKVRAIKGIGWVVVDYLQLCGTDLVRESRNNQIEEISRGLKALSSELEIPVIALAQLSREVERRATKRPTLADLRDSGAIEQDADIVLFLWPVRELETHKVVGLGIDKNRDGAVGGDMALEFWGNVQTFYESDVALEEPVARGGGRAFE